MSYTYNFVFTFQNLPGLTLNAAVYDAANPTPAQVGSTITSGFTDLGYGSYSFWATLPDGHVGSFVVWDSAVPARRIAMEINPQATELNAIADAILRRGSANSDSSADRDSLYELIAIMMRSQTVSTTLTAFKTDGTTAFGTRTLTLDNSAQPITKIE